MGNEREGERTKRKERGEKKRDKDGEIESYWTLSNEESRKDLKIYNQTCVFPFHQS